MIEEVKLKIKCVVCGFSKEVGKEQTEQPVCEKCLSPMILEKVVLQKKGIICQ